MTKRLQGFAFPFQIQNGRVAQSADFSKVVANVRHLLSTRLGERVMRRTYGSGLYSRLQEPNNDILHALIKYEFEQALRIFMPDLELTTPLDVTAREGELTVSFSYRADPADVVRRAEVALAP